MKNVFVLSLCSLLAGSALSAGELKFQSGFEDGLQNWELPPGRAQVSVSDIAASGKKAAEVRVDPAGKPE